MNAVHQPVLLKQVITALNIQADGIYVDGTFGRGGHATKILEKLSPKGRLYAIDQDPAAIDYATQELGDEKRFAIRQGSFQVLGQLCEDWSIDGRVTGLLFDLGVSSPQLDDSKRGFSFQSDGPLDMRMNYEKGISASEWLASVDEQELADVLWQYGEERYSRRIAKRIVEARKAQSIETTHQLVSIIKACVPNKPSNKHPATRCFQAIRIFINRELEALQDLLPQAIKMLAPAGRLAVISFHSLEDRIVKRFFREHSRGPQYPRKLPVRHEDTGGEVKLLGSAIKPDSEEIAVNPRARSAVLRVVEKVA